MPIGWGGPLPRAGASPFLANVAQTLRVCRAETHFGARSSTLDRQILTRRFQCFHGLTKWSYDPACQNTSPVRPNIRLPPCRRFFQRLQAASMARSLATADAGERHPYPIVRWSAESSLGVRGFLFVFRHRQQASLRTSIVTAEDIRSVARKCLNAGTPQSVAVGLNGTVEVCDTPCKKP
jgi:hypothetical protein